MMITFTYIQVSDIREHKQPKSAPGISKAELRMCAYVSLAMTTHLHVQESLVEMRFLRLRII